MSRERRRRRDERRSTTPDQQALAQPVAIDIGKPLTMPNGERWIFNITRAREIIRATSPRELHSFSGQQIAQLLARFQFTKKEVDTADHSIPGIAAVIPFGGQRTLQIIEGSERACRAFQINRPFLLYVLSDEERERCLWSRTGVAGVADRIASGP